MQKKTKWILAVTLSVVVFAAAAMLYQGLLNQYTPMQFSEENQIGEPEGKQQASKQAPDFTVYDAAGNQTRLSDFSGKPVVLNFWASWCTYCKREMPDFQAAFSEHPEIQFLMVNVTDGRQETQKTAMRFLQQNAYTFPVYYDLDLQAAAVYGASGLPMTFFINADGELVTYASGMLTAEALKKGIAAIA